MKLPRIGLGTWDLRGDECTKVVLKALELGYHHIDTAHVYENHLAICHALKKWDRSKIFLTSKLSLAQIHLQKIEASVEKACDLALKELGIDDLDLYLIHWPDRKFPLIEIFQGLEKLVKKGKIHRAGVSNFTIHHLQDLLNAGCKPAVNQVEFHPYLYQKELLEFCRLNQIELVAYRSFGKGALLQDPLFKTIGERYGKTSAQVILRWLFQLKIPVIPKASSEHHLAENLKILDFELTSSEMEEVACLHQGKRFCLSKTWGDFDY